MNGRPRRDPARPGNAPGSVHVGVDENGLGPRLGPLIVTAVVARIHGAGEEVAKSGPRGALAERVGDSKTLVSFGDSALGEAWARILASPDGDGDAVETPDALVRSLSIDTSDDLQRPCPPDHTRQCWGSDTEAFTAGEPLLATLRADVGRLAARGVDLVGAHVAIVCNKRLNEGASRGVTRFQADLHAMERLLLHARDRHGDEVTATCGKVGGYNAYPAAFGPLAGRLYTTLEEGRARSEYRVSGLGTVAFVRDADATHMLVSLASLVGKWVRDLLTRRVTRYHRAVDPSLPEASGYNDPITTRFIAESELSRRRRGVPDACFVRSAVEAAPPRRR